MKLFTKGIDKKLFAQYPKGGSLEGQKVIAKIFNPYGKGRWYIMNSDPDEPDYLWGIVELFQGEPEVGSFSREELENIKVGAFKLPLERDLYFDETDAMEVYNGLKSGKTFEYGGYMAKGGKITVGEKFGDWSVTQFTPVKYDDYGAPFGGVIKIVNQDDFETIVIRNDLSLRGAKWFVSLNKRAITDADPKIVIEKAISISKTKMAYGGEMDDEGVDLFEDYEDQPEEVSEILSKYELEDNDYDILEQLLGELEEVGYTFEYGLDGEPYDLRKIGQRGKSEFYAKGGKLQIVKDEDKNKGKLFYERFDGAIGSYGYIYEKRYLEGILYPLDDFDKEYYSHLKLKEGEMLFRYKTERVKFEWYFPLVKINLDKMLVYFLEDTDDDKNPTFNSRGTKLEYLAIEEYYYEVREFAKGGKIGDKVILTKGIESEYIFRNYPEGEYEIKKVVKGTKNFPEGFYEIENKDGRKTQLKKSRFKPLQSKSKNLDYTSKRKITNVTIKYEGKEYLVSGDDVITGAYKFAKGGLSDTHIYIPKRDVVKVTTKEGESINSPLNGVWVKKEYFERKESKGSGSYEYSEATELLAKRLDEFAKETKMTKTAKENIIIGLANLFNFEADLKHDVENNISGLAINTYAKSIKFVSKSKKGQISKNLALLDNNKTIDLFPSEYTKTTITSKKAMPFRGNLINNQSWLKELNEFTSKDSLRPAMTAIRFDGKSIVASDANVLVHLVNNESVEPIDVCVSEICKKEQSKDGLKQKYPDWRMIIAQNLNDSRYDSVTFDLDKLIVLVNWVNNGYSLGGDKYLASKVVAITTNKGDITFNSELLLKTLSMLKNLGVKKPIMYFGKLNGGIYFGDSTDLSGDPTNHNFVLCMPILSSYTKAFSLDVKTNEYKVVSPNYEFAKGGKMGDGKQLSIFA